MLNDDQIYLSQQYVFIARLQFSETYDFFSIKDDDDCEPYFSHSGCDCCNVADNNQGGGGSVIDIVCYKRGETEFKEGNQYDFRICTQCFSSMVNCCDDDLDALTRDDIERLQKDKTPMVWAYFNHKELQLPHECVTDCSAQGAVDDAVEHWQKELNLGFDRQVMIEGLLEFGAWDEQELNELDDDELEQKVIWTSCPDI